MINLNEDQVEQATLSLLKELNYNYIPGPDLAPDGLSPERELYSDVVLTNRLRTGHKQTKPQHPTIGQRGSCKEGFKIKIQRSLI